MWSSAREAAGASVSAAIKLEKGGGPLTFAPADVGQTPTTLPNLCLGLGGLAPEVDCAPLATVSASEQFLGETQTLLRFFDKSCRMPVRRME